MKDSSRHNTSANFDILNTNLYTRAQLFGKHISIQTIWPDQLRIFQLKQLKQTQLKQTHFKASRPKKQDFPHRARPSATFLTSARWRGPGSRWQAATPQLPAGLLDESNLEMQGIENASADMSLTWNRRLGLPENGNIDCKAELLHGAPEWIFKKGNQ